MDGLLGPPFVDFGGRSISKSGILRFLLNDTSECRLPSERRLVEDGVGELSIDNGRMDNRVGSRR